MRRHRTRTAWSAELGLMFVLTQSDLVPMSCKARSGQNLPTFLNFNNSLLVSQTSNLYKATCLEYKSKPHAARRFPASLLFSFRDILPPQAHQYVQLCSWVAWCVPPRLLLGTWLWASNFLGCLCGESSKMATQRRSRRSLEQEASGLELGPQLTPVSSLHP